MVYFNQDGNKKYITEGGVGRKTLRAAFRVFLTVIAKKGDVFMNITIIGRKCTPRASFKERAEKKLKKVERFFGEDVTAKITVTVEKNVQTVEITLIKDGMIFRAEEKAEHMNEALDLCVDVLVRQIRKNKTKLAKRFKAAGLEDLNGGDSAEVREELDFNIVRTKTVPLKPQTVDEAILQMNMLGHQFYMFLNAETDKISVVYVRHDGGYGMLEPELI